MSPAANVRIEDMGHKMGCNGVDNGKLWFDGVRVKRTALLNAFSNVSASGSFSSSIAKPRDRFLKVSLGFCVISLWHTPAACALPTTCFPVL
jgi:acyl-CoA oxidase